MIKLKLIMVNLNVYPLLGNSNYTLLCLTYMSNIVVIINGILFNLILLTLYKLLLGIIFVIF
mgnify:CR=1 FL=1